MFFDAIWNQGLSSYYFYDACKIPKVMILNFQLRHKIYGSKSIGVRCKTLYLSFWYLFTLRLNRIRFAWFKVGLKLYDHLYLTEILPSKFLLNSIYKLIFATLQKLFNAIASYAKWNGVDVESRIWREFHGKVLGN